MDGYLEQMWTGPGHLRFILQPLVAIILGIRDGLQDAKLGRPPYLFRVVKDKQQRRQELSQALRRLAIPLALGIVLDAILQVVIRGELYLVTALLFGTVFIAFPYSVARSWANRSSRARHRGEHATAA